jgi:propanediol dehydratase large subunit
MKTIYKNLLFGAVMMMFAALTATTTFAQDAADVCKEIEAKQALYKQFTDNFDKKDIERRKTAVTAGDQYVQKYGACADDKAIVDYLNANLPGMKTGIADEEKKAATQALYTRFNTAAESKNVAEIMASGKNILAKQPEFLDVIITLANAGFTQASANPPVESITRKPPFKKSKPEKSRKPKITVRSATLLKILSFQILKVMRSAN